MPLYFFDLHFGTKEFLDEEGIELSGALAARDEAMAAVRDLIGRSGVTAAPWAGGSIRVRDANGTQLLHLSLDPRSLEKGGPVLASTERKQVAAPGPGEAVGAGARLSVRSLLDRKHDGEHQRAIRQLDRCRSLMRSLQEEILSFRREIWRSRQLLARARSMECSTTAELTPRPAESTPRLAESTPRLAGSRSGGRPFLVLVSPPRA